jgi:hypothetical protein
MLHIQCNNRDQMGYAVAAYYQNKLTVNRTSSAKEFFNVLHVCPKELKQKMIETLGYTEFEVRVLHRW